MAALCPQSDSSMALSTVTSNLCPRGTPTVSVSSFSLGDASDQSILTNFARPRNNDKMRQGTPTPSTPRPAAREYAAAMVHPHAVVWPLVV